MLELIHWIVITGMAIVFIVPFVIQLVYVIFILLNLLIGFVVHLLNPRDGKPESRWRVP
jgi:hypothetical protein